MLRSPSALRIRTARPTDAAAIEGVFAQSWQLAYNGIIPASALDKIIKVRNTDWWAQALRAKDSSLVLEVSDTVAGYATYGSSRTRGKYKGEIYELYLAPKYQGLGFGEHLFEACRGALDQRKLNGLLVWALIDNTAACNFYWRRGGRPVASTFEAFDGAKLEKAAFAWP